MSKIVAILGEIILLISTPFFKRFVREDNFGITYGGC